MPCFKEIAGQTLNSLHSVIKKTWFPLNGDPKNPEVSGGIMGVLDVF